MGVERVVSSDAPVNEVAVTTVVVRGWHDWTITDLHRSDPRPLDLNEVLGLVGDAHRADVPVHPQLPPDEELAPIAPVALLAEHGGLVCGVRGTGLVEALDRIDVRILDALSGAPTSDRLAADLDISPQEAAARVAHLHALGLLELRTVARPDPRLHRPQTSVAHLDIAGVVRDPAALAPLRVDAVPVVSVWPEAVGPPLGLGMVLAAAAAHGGGRLTERYELRCPVSYAEGHDLLAAHSGPAVVMCSNYVWSTAANLEFVRRARNLNPEIIVIHGGPDTPGYARETEQFFASNPCDIAVRGEAEETFVEILDALSAGFDADALSQVDGISFRDPNSGEVVRTADRTRPEDLGRFESPYLSGFFDGIPEQCWDSEFGMMPIETNRGCPYGCTFCDWGAATRSRVRKFPIERVKAEIDWLGSRGLATWFLTDANFGMLPRDVEIAELIADSRRRTGVPTFLSFTPAKNSVKNLAKIFDTFASAGIATFATLAFQTRDQRTLEILDRSNISLDRYEQLAAEFRQLDIPLAADMIIGLPGATVETFTGDIQYCLDQEIQPRVWFLQVLPNAPMNDPEYRARYQIRTNSQHIVVASESFTEQDHDMMRQLRVAQRAFEHIGLLRHVMRHVQWDHGVPGTTVMRRIIDEAAADPTRYPLLTWVLRYLDIFLIVPVGWDLFYDEVARFLDEQFGIGRDAALDTVFLVQKALMPDRDRSFPSTYELDHDYAAYAAAATRHLHERDAEPTSPPVPLREFAAAPFTVRGDPAGVCDAFRRLSDDHSSDLFHGEYWNITHWELDSPLLRATPESRAIPGYTCRPSGATHER